MLIIRPQSCISGKYPVFARRSVTALALALTAHAVLCGALSAQETAAKDRTLRAPEGFSAQDLPSERGDKVLLTWKAMPYDSPDVTYVVQMARHEKGPFEDLAHIPSDRQLKTDKKWPFWAWKKTKDLHYFVATVPNADASSRRAASFTRKDEIKPAIIELNEVLRLNPRHLEAYRLRGLLHGKNGDSEKAIADFQSALKVIQDGLGEELPKFSPALEREAYYKLSVTDGKTTLASEAVKATASPNKFNVLKLNGLIFILVFAVVVLGYIALAKRKELFLRKIPGLSAVEEAIGRATEMGKPIFFLTGRLGVSSVSTIAATTILGQVAKSIARYDTQLRVPHTDPIVMALCQEVTKQAYIEAGRPDAYKEDSNFFITSDQFAYTAAVDGLMMREQPAACFYMGYYYAEALLLAEAGSGIGAIQIAGTDAESQLPFFITACDYTLIGEELYAASAYLSREPVQLGSLRGQDIGKAIIMAVILLGVVLGTVWLVFGLGPATGLSYERLLEPFKSF